MITHILNKVNDLNDIMTKVKYENSWQVHAWSSLEPLLNGGNGGGGGGGGNIREKNNGKRAKNKSHSKPFPCHCPCLLFNSYYVFKFNVPSSPNIFK